MAGKMLQAFLVLLVGFSLLTATAGCGFSPMVIGVGLATTTQSSAQAELPLARPETALDDVIRVGRSLHYRLTLKNEDTVCLAHTTPDLAEVAIGISQNVRVTARQYRDELDLKVTVQGEFGTGKQQAADYFLKQFQDKLLSQWEPIKLTQQESPTNPPPKQ